MITLTHVYKRFRTGNGDWHHILNDVSFTIPKHTSVGIIGKNGAGKSTLLRLIGGVDIPSKGTIEHHCKVSWPMGFSGGLQGSLTGRQNAKFVCRIYGHEQDMAQKIAFMQDFAEIGEAFDRPVSTYSSGMRSRLLFAMSLAFDFDVYISDEVTAVGDESFRQKAKRAFKALTGKASIIMVAHSPSTLKEFCSAGIWLTEGKAIWFDKIEDALAAYKQSINPTKANRITKNKKKTKNTNEPQQLTVNRHSGKQKQPAQTLLQLRQQLRQARQMLAEIKVNTDMTQPATPELKQARKHVRLLKQLLEHRIQQKTQQKTQQQVKQSPVTQPDSTILDFTETLS